MLCLRIAGFSVAFIISFIFSLLIFVGEVTLFSKKAIFPLNYLIRSIDTLNILNIVNLIVLSYMFAACLILFFEIKVKGFFTVERNQTDSVSFLFISSIMAKIGIPLCYNFAQLVELEHSLVINTIIDGSEDSNIVSEVQSFLPLIMFVFVIFKMCNLYERILNFIGYRAVCLNNQETKEALKNGRSVLRNS